MGCKTSSRGIDDDHSQLKEKGRENKLFFILLRQPHSSDDPRKDPKYKEGSFGSTGCHSDNIMRSGNIIKGDRLAFLQGGKDEKTNSTTIKIAFITPPINEVGTIHNNFVVKWESNWANRENRPLKFEYQADLLEKPNIDKFTKKEKEILKIINPNILNADCNSKAQKITSCTRCLTKGVKLDSTKSSKFIDFYKTNIKSAKERDRRKIFAEKKSDTYPKP